MKQLTRGHHNQQWWSDFEWNRAENDTQTRRFRGDWDYINNVALGFQNGFEAEAYSISNTDDGMQELTARVTSTDAIPQWELIGNELTNDIATHPRFKNIKDLLIRVIKTQADTPTTIANAYAVIDQRIDDDDLYPESAGYTAEVKAEIRTDSRLLLALYHNGTTEYIENQYVLRRQFIVGNGYTTKFEYNNLNRLYTTQQLENEMAANGTPIPATLSFSARNIRIEDVISKLTVEQAVPVHRQYAFDFKPMWLKKRPTVTSQGGGRFGLRFQIDQEFWLYNWNRRVYLPVSQAHWAPDDVANNEGRWLPKVVPYSNV